MNKKYNITIQQFNKLSVQEQGEVLKAYGKAIDTRISRQGTNPKIQNLKSSVGINKFEHKQVKGVSNTEYFKVLKAADPGVRSKNSIKTPNVKLPKANTVKPPKEPKAPKRKLTKFEKLKAQAEGKTGVLKSVGKKRLEKYRREKLKEIHKLRGRQKALQEAGINVDLVTAKEMGEVFKTLREQNILNIYVDSDTVYDLLKNATDRVLDIKDSINNIINSTKDGNAKQTLIDMLKMEDASVFYAPFDEDRDDTSIVQSLLNR